MIVEKEGNFYTFTQNFHFYWGIRGRRIIISTPSIMLLMIAFFCSGQIQHFYSRLDTLTWSGHLPAGEDDGKFIIIDEPTGQPD